MKFRKSAPPEGRNRQVINEPKMEVSSTYSYSSRRSEDTVNKGRSTEPEKPKSTLKQKLFKVELLVCLVIALFVLYQGLYISPDVEVKPFSSSQNITVSQQAMYKTDVDKIIKSTFLDNNKITFDGSSLETKLKSDYPLIQTATISLGLFSNKPTIYIAQSQAVITLKTVQNEYFSINLSGQAIGKASSIDGLSGINASTPLITDQSGIKISNGMQALPSSYVAFILTVQEELKAKGYAITTYTLPAETDELDVGIAGQAYIVKFNLADNDPRQQSGTYLATIEQLKSQNITPGKYIDVRVDGRAYYQ